MKNYLLRFSVFILFLSLMGVSFSQVKTSDGVKISLHVKDLEIKKILILIESKVDFKFVYSSELIQSSKKISIDANDQPLSEVLKQILNPLQLKYEIAGKSIIISRNELQKISDFKNGKDSVKASIATMPAGEVLLVNGKVSDSKSPLANTTILVKGKQLYATSKADG